MKKIFTLLLITLLLSCKSREYILIHAVTGTICEENNYPLQGALIDAYSPGGTKTFNEGAVISDSLGRFFKEGMVSRRFNSYFNMQKHISFVLMINKEGYLPDTLDLGRYVYFLDSATRARGAVRTYDTVDVGRIVLKRR